jgi:hypothetical protein
MSRKSTSLVAFALSLVLVFSATGCGKKKSTTTTTAAAVMTDTTATDTTASDTVTTETSATETTATETSSTDTNALGDLTSAGNCAQLAGIGQTLSQALSGAGSGDVEKSSKLMHEFADKTPDEIRSDFQTLADAYSKLVGALKGVDLSSGKTPSPDVIAKLLKIEGEIDQQKLAKASANISAWASKNCGATP